MCNLEELNCYLRENLSEERYNHSVRVMMKAIEYAVLYHCSVSIVMLVALGHDIAKEMSFFENQKYVIENNLDSSLLSCDNKYKLHGYVGASILEKKFGFTQEMGDAVREHTTANKEMSVLSKILFLADKTEEGRSFDFIQEERKLALEDLDKAMLFALQNTVRHTIEKGKEVDSMTMDAIDYFSNLVLKKEKSLCKVS